MQHNLNTSLRAAVLALALVGLGGSAQAQLAVKSTSSSSSSNSSSTTTGTQSSNNATIPLATAVYNALRQQSVVAGPDPADGEYFGGVGELLDNVQLGRNSWAAGKALTQDYCTRAGYTDSTMNAYCQAWDRVTDAQTARELGVRLAANSLVLAFFAEHPIACAHVVKPDKRTKELLDDDCAAALHQGAWGAEAVRLTLQYVQQVVPASFSSEAKLYADIRQALYAMPTAAVEQALMGPGPKMPSGVYFRDDMPMGVRAKSGAIVYLQNGALSVGAGGQQVTLSREKLDGVQYNFSLAKTAGKSKESRVGRESSSSTSTTRN